MENGNDFLPLLLGSTAPFRAYHTIHAYMLQLKESGDSDAACCTYKLFNAHAIKCARIK